MSTSAVLGYDAGHPWCYGLGWAAYRSARSKSFAACGRVGIAAICKRRSLCLPPAASRAGPKSFESFGKAYQPACGLILRAIVTLSALCGVRRVPVRLPNAPTSTPLSA